VALVAASTQQRGAAIGLLALVLAVPPVKTVLEGARGADLIPVLGATGRAQLVVGLVTAAGLALA
jgi:1,4-dihydroxy-2-naphthoate octaprenyltransferase